MCNPLSHIRCIVISLNGKHKLFFIRLCRGCVRYCHHNRSCYRVEDFWAIKCGVAPYLQGEVTWEWGGCYSSTCFSQGPSAKILTLAPTALLDHEKAQIITAAQDKVKKSLKSIHAWCFGVKWGLSEPAAVIMDPCQERAPSPGTEPTVCGFSFSSLSTQGCCISSSSKLKAITYRLIFKIWAEQDHLHVLFSSCSN